MGKKKIKYKICESDSEDWIIIELLDKKIKLDVHKDVLKFRYDCIPHKVILNDDSHQEVFCSRFCCYAGCYVSPLEIRNIEMILPDLKKNYLPKDSLRTLVEFKDEFYLPEDYDEEENLYKTRCSPVEPSVYHYDEALEDKNSDSDDDEENEEDDEENNIESYETEIESVPESHCIFLMEKGLCSIHKYYNDNIIDWTTNKFNICTTFPLDIRVTSNATSSDSLYPYEKRVNDDCSTIKMMDDYTEFLFIRMDCINLSPLMKKAKRIPYILESMKYAIATRFGVDMWEALVDYGSKFRSS